MQQPFPQQGLAPQPNQQAAMAAIQQQSAFFQIFMGAVARKFGEKNTIRVCAHELEGIAPAKVKFLQDGQDMVVSFMTDAEHLEFQADLMQQQADAFRVQAKNVAEAQAQQEAEAEKLADAPAVTDEEAQVIPGAVAV
jgi:hypothetical protein